MNNQARVYSKLYFMFFALSLFVLFYAHSRWRFHSILSFFLSPICLFLSLMVLGECIKKLNLREIVIGGIFLCFVVFNSYLAGDYYGIMLWLLFILIVGAKNIEFIAIVKFHLIVEICLCLSTGFADFLGLSDKNLMYSGDERIGVFENYLVRLDFGYRAATDFATHVFYMLLDYWIIMNGRLRWFEFLSYFVIGYVLIIYCDARQATVCVLLIIICSLYIRNKGRRKVSKFLGLLLVFGIPLLCLISYFATLLYDESDFYWIAADLLLSNRLHLGNDAIQEMGIGFFAQSVEMFGSGAAGGMNEYNYVDNSYIQFLIRWGFVLVVLSMFVFVKIGKDAYRRNDVVLLFSLLIAGISSIITQYLFFPNYCVLILALLAGHNSPNNIACKNADNIISK